MTFYGRGLARNDGVWSHAVPPPTKTETALLYGQLGSTIVALLMLIVSVRDRRIGRKLFALLFAWAATANAWTALNSPLDYLGYGAFAISDVYRWFIFGFFGQHVTAIVLAIAIGQACIAVSLLNRGRWQRVGLGAAIVFLLAIAPLGVGAGAPATVILALGAGVLWREPASPRVFIEFVPRRSLPLRRAA
jgi:hypothetical protein